MCSLSYPHSRAKKASFQMEISQMTQKWSSRPKDHHATRVRENQRRHRARTKAYIASLEKQLIQVQARLDEVLRENSKLLATLEEIKAGGEGVTFGEGERVTLAVNVASDPPPIPDRCFTSSPSPVPDDSEIKRMTRMNSNKDSSASGEATRKDGIGMRVGEHSREQRARPDCLVFSPLSATPSSIEPFGSGEDLAVNPKDCQHLPAPRPGESTIPCAAAYGIIEQHNFGGGVLDMGIIDRFLAPGFRRAVTSEGCRVESHLVFSVLDSLH